MLYNFYVYVCVAVVVMKMLHKAHTCHEYLIVHLL